MGAGRALPARQDKPSPAAEFAQPDVLIGFTVCLEVTGWVRLGHRVPKGWDIADLTTGRDRTGDMMI